MHIFKKLFEFYIFSNIHVAFSVFSLTKITLLEYDIESNLLPWFVFFSTVLSYNFIRIYKVSEIQYWFINFFENFKLFIIILSIISFIMIGYLVFFLNTKAFIALIPFGIFTLFYTIPINFKKANPLTLRSIVLLKLFLIAISWAGVTVIVPLVNYDVAFSAKEIIILLQRFLFIIAITIPFDIRDMEFDSVSLQTLPQIVGVKSSKKIGLLCLLLFLGLEFLQFPIEVANFRIDLIVSLISLILLLKATVKQHKYYSAFLIEAIPILWLFLVIIIK